MATNESTHYYPCRKNWKTVVWCGLAMLLFLIYCTVSSTQDRIAEYQQNRKEQINKYNTFSYNTTKHDSTTNSHSWTYPVPLQSSDEYYPLTLSVVLSITVVICLCIIALKLINLYQAKSDKETEILSYLYKDEQQRLIIKRDKEPVITQETEHLMRTLEKELSGKIFKEMEAAIKSDFSSVESLLNKAKSNPANNNAG